MGKRCPFCKSSLDYSSTNTKEKVVLKSELINQAINILSKQKRHLKRQLWLDRAFEEIKDLPDPALFNPKNPS